MPPRAGLKPRQSTTGGAGAFSFCSFLFRSSFWLADDFGFRAVAIGVAEQPRFHGHALLISLRLRPLVELGAQGGELPGELRVRSEIPLLVRIAGEIIKFLGGAGMIALQSRGRLEICFCGRFPGREERALAE